MDQVIRLWEAFWACPSTPNLDIYACAALLLRHKREIICKAMGHDELTRFCNDMAGKLDVEQLLRDAHVLAEVAGSEGAAKLEALQL